MMWAITIVVKPVLTAAVEEQRQQRGAEHDLGRRQREEDEEVDDARPRNRSARAPAP